MKKLLSIVFLFASFSSSAQFLLLGVNGNAIDTSVLLKTADSILAINKIAINNHTSQISGLQPLLGFTPYNATNPSGYISSYTETDPIVKAINGIVKSNGTTISAAVVGTDYLSPTGSAAGLTGFPTLNQSTTGNATTATNLTGLTATVTTLNNQSGINTGDNSANSLYSGLVTNATHTGDATGATALTVKGINGTLLSGLATGILKNTTTTGVPSVAIASDFPALPYQGALTVFTSADAAITINPNSTVIFPAATLTVGRIATITAGSINGDRIELFNKENGFAWTLGGSPIYYNDGITTLTTVLANTITEAKWLNGKYQITN